jgi:hypothetical protein
MDEAVTGDESSTTVAWHPLAPRDATRPFVRRLPYLELTLEHPGLEPTAYGSRFFPDAVPYELDGTARVFYWRSALGPSAGEPADWTLACATTHELTGVDSFPMEAPSLVTDGARGTTLVVDGTVAGDATTTTVESYDVPTITLDSGADDALQVTVEGTDHALAPGDRRRLSCAERRVEPVDGDPTTVTPELVARYPGRRELHHPAPGSSTRLFPSFGLDLAAVPNPLSVPTTAGELDHSALATALGVDVAQRPYPERVLWQAFAYAAFDPHADATAELAQLESGHVLVQPGTESTTQS